MRVLVVLALVAANALLIFVVGSDISLMSSLITFFIIVGYLAWSFARNGVEADHRTPDGSESAAVDEGDAMVHRGRAMPP